MLEENKIVFSLNIFYFSICLSSNKLYWIEDQLADVSTRFYTSASWRWRVEPSATWLDTIKIVCLQLVASKIKFHIRILLRKANWNFVVSLIKPKPRYIAILNKWRYNDQEKKKYHKEGSLIGCCLSGLCPLYVKYIIKCRLFTRNWHATQENCFESSLSVAFNSMWIFFSRVGQCSKNIW